jgi:outer membrane biosynthesis protein TonB
LKQPIFIRIFKNDKLEGIKQFQITQIVFGANADVQVALEGPEIAPLHALIEDRDTGYYISDLGSETGTRRNGHPILDEQLESGDEVQIGPYRLQFFIGIPKPLNPPAGSTSATAAPAPQPVETKTVETPPAEAKKPEVKVAESKPVEAQPAPAPTEVKKPAKVTHTPPAVTKNPPKNAASKSKEPAPATPKTTKSEEVPPAIMAATENKGAKGKMTPRAGARSSAGGMGMDVVKAHPKSRATFAPPSYNQDLNRTIRPGKGTLVEIIVAWKERILSVHHFNERREITIGADPSADILVPLLGRGSAFPIVKIGALATVRITGQMSGDFTNSQQTIPIQDLLRQNRLRGQGNVFELDLNQGELVRIGFVEDLISVYVRYTSESPKPLFAPILDLTASEVTGVILAGVVSAIFSLYMMVYAPQNMEDENKVEEPIRIATVTFKPPPVNHEEPEKQPPPPPEPPKEKKVVKESDKTQQQQSPKPSSKSASNPGTASEVAPKETTDKRKRLTSAKPGGSIKTAPKAGANAKSEKPDPTKVGLLSVFGTKGAMTKLDRAYSGSGELQGIADSATGYAGSNEDRAGEGLGTKLKDTGAGGNGTSSVGIAGVGTKGKGTGSYGYGTGGLGQKGKVGINLEGTDAEFKGTIDRDEVRRVILANKRTIQNCYNIALARNPELYGKIVLSWTIEERGRVANATVKSSSVDNPQVANCILEHLKTWKFPDPPPDSVGQVSFPFVFTSQ